MRETPPAIAVPSHDSSADPASKPSPRGGAAAPGHHHGPGAHGDGHGHGAGTPPGTEAFPRLEVSDLVARGMASGRRREMVQDGAIALGLALLALSQPTERLLGDGPALVRWTHEGHWLSLHLLLQPLAQLLARGPSLGAERAWFLIAAISWAAAYPVLARLGVRAGYSRLAAGAGALLCLVSPVAVLAGTLPGPAGPLVFGSAVLFAALERARQHGGADPSSLGVAQVSPSSPKSPKSNGALLGLWIAVALLEPNLVLLLPAVLWCGISGEIESSKRWRFVVSGLCAAGLLLALMIGCAFLGSGERPGDTLNHLLARLVGTTSLGSPGSLIWLAVLVPSLGVAVVGVVELFRRPGEAHEGPAPGWLAAFVGVPILVKVLAGTPGLDTSSWVLLPVCALGLAAFLQRLPESRRMGLIVALFGIQMALNVGFHWAMRLGDPTREWVASAARTLNPGDMVITKDQVHDYLLHHRFRVRTINLRTPVELASELRADWWYDARELVRDHARHGGRLVLDWKVDSPPSGARDYPFPRELHELVLLGPFVHLGPKADARVDLDQGRVPTTFEPENEALPAALKKP